MSTRRAGCLAVRYCDQEACGFCGLQWDHDDPDLPACRREELTERVVYMECDYSRDELAEHMVKEINRSHVERASRRGWSVTVERQPVVIRGPRQPDRLVPLLSVDGVPCGPLCAPVSDTARGRLDLWELVLRLNVRR